MAFTIAQVSDTHLAAESALFRGNFARIEAAVVALKPDVTVLSGDMSFDGAGTPADLASAAMACRGFGPVYAVPGNHDVGDPRHRNPQQPVTDATLAHFRQHFGPDRWMFDRPGWRVLGLDSQIMNAHESEAAQADFIIEALATLGTRNLAVFLHKPVFVQHVAETAFEYWTVPPASRGALHPLLAHPALRLVASGHLHVRHAMERGLVSYQWAPSTAFVVRPEDQPGLPGLRVCGALLHRFGADRVETTLIFPDGLERPFIHEVATGPD